MTSVRSEHPARNTVVDRVNRTACWSGPIRAGWQRGDGARGSTLTVDRDRQHPRRSKQLARAAAVAGQPGFQNPKILRPVTIVDLRPPPTGPCRWLAPRGASSTGPFWSLGTRRRQLWPFQVAVCPCASPTTTSGHVPSTFVVNVVVPRPRIGPCASILLCSRHQPKQRLPFSRLARGRR